MIRKSNTAAERGSGILLHISSLPSSFGIGDLGPEAYRFVDFLAEAGQKFWQILPLNAVESQQAYSPYSSSSSMAGNILFISPERIADSGLVATSYFSKIRDTSKIDYQRIARVKKQLLDEAYGAFTKSKTNYKRYLGFVAKNENWLHDFALFTALRNEHKKPWFSWPSEIRQRKNKAMAEASETHRLEIEKIKWTQFIFFEQWDQLKGYCHDKGVKIIGDLPFYVSYDSADVWSHQKYFSLTSDGKLKGVAGVPPDYFNEDGQLWGMPVFRWNTLRKHKYNWWIERLRKNVEMFDIVRLDHFRAFADYWEVNAGQKTARNGKWRKGPGYDFFDLVRKHFPTLPFIAEDLGDINEKVVALRDDYDLPGMKILQFGFGSNIAESEHSPHNFHRNFFAYTGTHDNNTTLGWFRKDAGKVERSNLSTYTGVRVSEQNVCEVFIRLALASVASVVIIPMQDILKLDEKSRMNVPSTTSGNWSWKMSNVNFQRLAKDLHTLTALTSR